MYFAKIVVAVAEGGAVFENFFNACVENGGGAVVIYGAPGEAAIGVVPAGSGRERDRQVAPVNHVWAYGVGPVHVSPDGGTGVVLEEHMVVAIPIYRAIRVVHPVFGREEMELRTERVFGKLLLKLGGGAGRAGWA